MAPAVTASEAATAARLVKIVVAVVEYTLGRAAEVRVVPLPRIVPAARTGEEEGLTVAREDLLVRAHLLVVLVIRGLALARRLVDLESVICFGADPSVSWSCGK